MNTTASSGGTVRKPLEDLASKLPKELPGGPLSKAEEKFLARKKQDEAQLKAMLDFISDVEKLKDVFKKYHSKDVSEKERRFNETEFSKTAKAMGLDASKFKNAKEFLDSITDRIEGILGFEKAENIILTQGRNTLQARAELWPKEWGPIVSSLGIKTTPLDIPGKPTTSEPERLGEKTGGLSNAENLYLEYLAKKEEERKKKEREGKEPESKATPTSTPARPTSVTITSVGGGKTVVEDVSSSEADRILSKAEYHTDYFIGELNSEVLKKEGLAPKKKVVMDGVTVWLSDTYKADNDGRIAVVGFVERDRRIVARTFYRSNSQGIWRYLPSYTADDSGNIDWYHKGFGEESIMLPIRMQKALAEISKDESSTLTVSNPKLIFAGTARRMKKGVVISMAVDVESNPQRIKGNFYETKNKTKNEGTPGSLIFADKNDAPDTSTNPLDSWQQTTAVYGEISIEVYASRNGKYHYMLCTDKKGRAWIGGIEDVNSPLTSTGLKKRWIKAENLTTPAYEYKGHAGGYGNPKLRIDHLNYIDMYENYLSQIPLIKEYQENRSKRAKTAA